MTHWVGNGYGLDRALGAMFFGAKQGETVSVMAARARVSGRRWGCVLCWLLSTLVEPDHCAKALGDATPTAAPAAYRAGALLLVVTIALWAVPWLAWRLGAALLG